MTNEDWFSLEKAPWFYGSASRLEAEQILAQFNKDCLLVRPSSISGNFALSKYFPSCGAFSHQLILKTPKGFLIEDGSDPNYYDSVQSLIEKSTECKNFVLATKGSTPPSSDTTKEEDSHYETLPLQLHEDTNIQPLIVNLGPIKRGRGLTIPEQEMEKKRKRIIAEILMSEEDYGKDLAILYKHYAFPMTSEKIVSEKDAQILFSNIAELIDINTSLLRALQHRKEDEIDQMYVVGDVFIKMANEFKIYTLYCNSFVKSQKLLLFYNQNSNFQSFQEKAKSDPETKGLDLNSYLIKPIQRVCKYPLFLKQLVDSTPKDHVEYNHLNEALEKFEEVVQYINENKRLYEIQGKLRDLQESIDGLPFELVEPTRYLKYELSVTKICKGNKEKFFEAKVYVFNDIFLYVKKKSGEGLTYRWCIPIEKLRLIVVVDSQFSKSILQISEVDNPNKVTIFTNSEQEKKMLLDQVKSAQKQFFLEQQNKSEEERRVKKYLGSFEFNNKKKRLNRISIRVKEFKDKTLQTLDFGMASNDVSLPDFRNEQPHQATGFSSLKPQAQERKNLIGARRPSVDNTNDPKKN